jgi:hypothetical protein
MENNKIKADMRKAALNSLETTIATIDIIDIELIATIDEINQYMEGNVTKESLQMTIEELALTLSKI